MQHVGDLAHPAGPVRHAHVVGRKRNRRMVDFPGTDLGYTEIIVTSPADRDGPAPGDRAASAVEAITPQHARPVVARMPGLPGRDHVQVTA